MNPRRRKKLAKIKNACLTFGSKIMRCRKVLLPQGDIKLLDFDPNSDGRWFALRSPLTNEWSEFFVSEKHLASDTIPREILDFVTYYEDMTEILKYARIVAPMRDDLSALDNEEAKIFGAFRMPVLMERYKNHSKRLKIAEEIDYND